MKWCCKDFFEDFCILSVKTATYRESEKIVIFYSPITIILRLKSLKCCIDCAFSVRFNSSTCRVWLIHPGWLGGVNSIVPFIHHLKILTIMKKFQSRSIAKLRLNKTTLTNLSAMDKDRLAGGGGTNNAANAAGTLTTVGNSCGCSTAEVCVFCCCDMAWCWTTRLR